MHDKSLPLSGKDAELIGTLERIAASLERLGDIALNLSCVFQDHSRDLNATLAESLYKLRDKPPTKGKARQW